MDHSVESAADQSPVERLLAAERSDQLDRLLTQLRRSQADALRLRFFGGLKFHEIADAMQCSLNTAKNRVRNGLIRMAQLIDTAGLTGAPGRPQEQESREL